MRIRSGFGKPLAESSRPSGMGKVRVALCAAGVVLVLAGCSHRVGGSLVTSGAPTEPLDSDVFDDLSTVDPCSLTGPGAFEEYGTAAVPGRPSLDECAVRVATGGGRVTVRLDEWQTEDALPADRDEVATPDDGTSIVRIGRNCDMALVSSDGLAVLCGLAQGVYDVAAGGRVEHWDDLPANSFGRVSACDLLDTDEVAATIGDTAKRTDTYPAEHQCRVDRSGGDAPTAKLDFPVAESAQDAGVPASATVEPIGGRPSWAVDAATGDLTVCTVFTEHIDFEPGASPPPRN
jgi:hypothetical protein